MRDDEEFTSYAASRWAALVRVVVLLGRPPASAVRLATLALARARRSWDLGPERPDPDVVVHAELLRVVAEDRHRFWEERDPGEEELLELSGLRELEPALDALDPAGRSRLVLEAVAPLDPEQLDLVAPELPSDRDRPAVAAVRFVAAALVVAAYPAEDVRRLAGARARSRRLARTAAAAVALAVVGAVVPVVASQVQQAARVPVPDPFDATLDRALGGTPSPVPLPERPSGVPVAWAAEGRLHLADRVIRLDRVVGLGETPDGVVAVLADGRLVQPLLSEVAAGLVSELGAVDPGQPVVTSHEEERVAWIDRGETTRLVVRDLATGIDLLSGPVPPGTRVVALRGQVVWTTDAAGYAATPLRTGRTRPTRFPGPRLVALATGVRVVAPDPGHLALLVGDADPLEVAGDDAVLSDDGRYAAVHDPGAARTWSVLDLASGTTVALPLPDGAQVQSVGFAADDRVVLALSLPEDRPYSIGNDQPVGQGPIYDLVTCDPQRLDCQEVERLAQSSAAPVLPR